MDGRMNKEPESHQHTDSPDIWGRFTSVPQRRRRASLPTPANLRNLHRTTSHKKLPHLAAGRVMSTPINFTPKCTGDKKIHTCHSYCALPHLPGTSSRRKSLPPTLTLSNLTPIVEVNKTRRQSFPLDVRERHERALHRCKALHKTNITFEDIASELRNISEQQRMHKARSDPMICNQAKASGSSPIDTQQSSKSFHTMSSILLMQHVDTSLTKVTSGRVSDAPSLAQIQETAVIS